MKLDFGETFQEKEQRLRKWHKWFAWHPVKVAEHDYRWLEYVFRSGQYIRGFEDGYFCWTYLPVNRSFTNEE